MRISRGWPPALAALALVIVATMPLVYDTLPLAGALAVVAVVAAGVSRMLRRAVPP